jgi:glutathione peroxidase
LWVNSGYNLIIKKMGVVGFLLEKLSRTKNFGKATGSIYDFKVKSLTGKEIDLSQFAGKNLLIVNTASKCGYTYQYEDLQKLHEQYGSKVQVIGFPANNFLKQEPGTNNDIAEFCQVNYGVSFPMTEKISVKGSTKHPIFNWLSAKTGREPSWNFCKYLITDNGEKVKFFSSDVKPLDPAITESLK